MIYSAQIVLVYNNNIYIYGHLVVYAVAINQKVQRRKRFSKSIFSVRNADGHHDYVVWRSNERI